MKGLIPAAGKGTRLRPFTKAYPKELLPVGEKAVIEHAINDLKQAGITEICVVVGWKQHAILDYLGSGRELGVELTYVVQDNRNGLAGAVKAGQHVIEDERFAVILGDNYADNKEAMKDLVEYHKNKDLETTIGAFETEEVESYGIIDGQDGEVDKLVEKPPKEEAPSNLAIAGMYVFEPEIFEAIDKIGKGKGGEYQLTDAIDLLAKSSNVGYREIKGNRIDVGTPERLRKANRNLGLRD